MADLRDAINGPQSVQSLKDRLDQAEESLVKLEAKVGAALGGIDTYKLRIPACSTVYS